MQNQMQEKVNQMTEKVNQITEKICTKCNEKKTMDSFHKHSMSKDGYQPRCKECRRDDMVENCHPSKPKIDYSQIVIENIPYENNGESNYISLKKLVEQLGVNQSFAIPQSVSHNLRNVLNKEFPHMKVKLRRVEGSNFVRAFRIS